MPTGVESKEPADDETPRTLRVVYQDGSRFSGVLTSMEENQLTLSCRGVREACRLPLAGVRSLIPLRHGERPDMPAVAGRPGRLEMQGVSLKGRLVADGQRPDANLAWHPEFARNSSPLLAGMSGRIVYREPPPPAPPPNTTARRVRRMIVNGAIVESAAEPPQKPRAAAQRSMHLRTGDTIPCEVTAHRRKGRHLQGPAIGRHLRTA